MKKWPFLLFLPLLAFFFIPFIVFSTEPHIRPATFVQPAGAHAAISPPISGQASAVPDSFPGPLMTDDRHYTLANTHSHNDYEQAVPFWTAYDAQFGSIEADIFLVDGRLYVAHDRKELQLHRTLEEYYVKPLAAQVERNHGHPYADSARQLQMLIDVKADSTAALAALVQLLEQYPGLTQTPSLTWVISGNRPEPRLYATYPPFISFDGILGRSYPPAALSRIVMMSDDLHEYTRWNGLDPIPARDKKKILAAIAWSHALHLPVRFWDAPDFPNAWEQLTRLRVDFINTDHIRQLANWLSAHP